MTTCRVQIDIYRVQITAYRGWTMTSQCKWRQPAIDRLDSSLVLRCFRWKGRRDAGATRSSRSQKRPSDRGFWHPAGVRRLGPLDRGCRSAPPPATIWQPSRLLRALLSAWPLFHRKQRGTISLAGENESAAGERPAADRGRGNGEEPSRGDPLSWSGCSRRTPPRCCHRTGGWGRPNARAHCYR